MDKVKDGRRVVVLFVNSLFMAGLEVSLKDRLGLTVAWVEATEPNAKRRLNELCPDVVICDLTTVDSQFVLSFLRNHPDLPLIGLDSTIQEVTVLSSEQYIVRTTSDLVRLIQTQTGSRDRGV